MVQLPESNTKQQGWFRRVHSAEEGQGGEQTTRSQATQLVKAATFSLEELTAAYNQTRIDYIVPMPMTVAKLQAYIHAYDVDLSASFAAVDGETKVILGIGLLGLREKRSWITRLGVLPISRGRGVGELIMRALLRESQVRKVNQVWLEVIEGNTPALRLFEKLGFTRTRDLIVARRAPAKVVPPLEPVTAEVIESDKIQQLLAWGPHRPNWLNDAATFANLSQLRGHILRFATGQQGWVIYEPTLLSLNRVTVGLIDESDTHIAAAVLCYLHSRFAQLDAISENIPVNHPYWPAYVAAGYFETFRRVEMVKDLTDNKKGEVDL